MAKTINVQQMKDWANGILASTDEFFTAHYKAGICSMIEKILHESKNYNGFMFINNEDSDHGTLGYFTRKYF